MANGPWKNSCSGRTATMLRPGALTSKTGHPLAGLTSVLFLMNRATLEEVVVLSPHHAVEMGVGNEIAILLVLKKAILWT